MRTAFHWETNDFPIPFQTQCWWMGASQLLLSRRKSSLLAKAYYSSSPQEHTGSRGRKAGAPQVPLRESDHAVGGMSSRDTNMTGAEACVHSENMVSDCALTTFPTVSHLLSTFLLYSKADRQMTGVGICGT